jgi:hypothetical protein
MAISETTVPDIRKETASLGDIARGSSLFHRHT